MSSSGERSHTILTNYMERHALGMLNRPTGVMIVAITLTI